MRLRRNVKNMSKIEEKKGIISIRCKTKKEFNVMLTLIVYIQSWYKKEFAKNKKVNLKSLVAEAIRDLHKRGYDEI